MEQELAFIETINRAIAKERSVTRGSAGNAAAPRASLSTGS